MGEGGTGPSGSEHLTLVHTRPRPHADFHSQTAVQFRLFARLERRFNHVEISRRRRSLVVVREKKTGHDNSENRESKMTSRGQSLSLGDASAAAAAVTAAAAKNVVQQTQGLLTVVGDDPSDFSPSVCLCTATPPTTPFHTTAKTAVRTTAYTHMSVERRQPGVS